jgi:hypothetical protein
MTSYAYFINDLLEVFYVSVKISVKNMKNRKVIIHIGLQKTASTYLQKIVFPKINHTIYLSRPYTQENFAFNCLQYADDSLYDASMMIEEVDRIEKKLGQDNNKPLLISDELFSGCPSYNFINRGIIAKRLSKVFPDAEIILFIRGQVNLIESMYNQRVKVGWITEPLNDSFLHKPGKGFSLEQWLQGERKWNFKNRFFYHRALFTPEHFRYSKLYFLYSELFDKVHVFLYEDIKNDEKAFLDRLGAVLSTDLSSILEVNKNQQKEPINKRLDDQELVTRLTQNKLAKIFPLFKTKYGKLLLNTISPFLSYKEKNAKEYIVSLLKEHNIFDDNYLLNQKMILGMEKFAEQYFGDSKYKD